jgi:enoyl-CoA hydratase/carnithine racemase
MAATGILPALEQLPGCLRLRLGEQAAGGRLAADRLLGVVAALAPDRRRPLPLVIEGDARCFSVGHDLAELRRFDGTAAVAYSRLGHQAVDALEQWPGVTIALIRGPCLGPGLELALGCDLILAGPGSRFGLPGLALGLMPCMGGLRRLAARCGPEVVRDLFLAGRTLGPRLALRRGLADRMAGAALTAEACAQRWGRWDPGAVLAIRGIRLHRIGHVDAGAEADLFAHGFATGECQRRLGRV